MFARAATATVLGVQAFAVVVEAHRANGLPSLTVIGLARGAMREAATRVRSAIAAAGIKLTPQRAVVNLLPAELPKEGSGLDLAMAVSLLAAAGELPLQALAGRRFVGELSLGGGVEGIRGAVAIADLARQQGDRELFLPAAHAPSAAAVAGVRVVAVHHLTQVLQHLRGTRVLPAAVAAPPAPAPAYGCLAEVVGQKVAKRALEVAAAGGHNMLMMGAPGSGKTMLAQRLPGLLPPLSARQAIEVTRIHAAAAATAPPGLLQAAPFRAPHHTASEPALCGGGSGPRPGEVTLAHHGVLFLDELPEFSRRALEALREPLEEQRIHIARANLSLCFPADVLLLAAMNPCPCGYAAVGMSMAQRVRGAMAGAATPSARVCMCPYERIVRYQARISGPLLDRIDMHVAVQQLAYRDFARGGTGPTSAMVAARVQAARERQAHRLGGDRLNGRMTPAELAACVQVGAAGEALLSQATHQHGLSTRAISRILKVARTIADLAGAQAVQPKDISEAIGLRLLDGKEGHHASLRVACSDANVSE